MNEYNEYNIDRVGYVNMDIDQYIGLVIAECEERGYDVQFIEDISKYFHLLYRPEVAATEAIREDI